MKALLAIVLALIVAGCATVTAPKGFDGPTAYAYAQVAGARDTAASLLERGRIGADEARAVQQLADQAAAALDAALTARGAGDLTTAEAQLRLAQSILVSLEHRLKEQTP